MKDPSLSTKKNPIRHVEKLKNSGYKPWRLLASYAIFIGIFAVIPLSPRLFEHPVNWIIALYFLFMAGASVIEAVQGRIPFKPGPLIGTFLDYVLKTTLEIFASILVIPLLGLHILAGPLMLTLFLGSIFGIAIYVIEVVFGYDIKGYGSILNGIQVLIAIPVAVLSFWAMMQFLKVYDFIEKMMDKIVDFILYLYRGKKKDSPVVQDNPN